MKRTIPSLAEVIKEITQTRLKLDESVLNKKQKQIPALLVQKKDNSNVYKV